MNDSKKAKVVQITDLKNQQLIRQNKITSTLKAKKKKRKVVKTKNKVK